MSDYYDEQIVRLSVSVPAGQTDAVIFAGQPNNQRLRVLAAYALAPAATPLQFNSKGSGAGTVLSGPFTSADGKPTLSLDYCPAGWFQTGKGEALTATSGAGQAHSLFLTVAVVAGGP
jgi:hypothetical protein